MPHSYIEVVITNCERCVKISRIKLNCRSQRQSFVIAQQHIRSPPVQFVNITIIQRRWLMEHLEIPILQIYFGGNINLCSTVLSPQMKYAELMFQKL